MSDINLWIVLGAAFLGGLVPGPSMLAIAGTAMGRGRRHGFAVAYGMTAGGFVWAIFAIGLKPGAPPSAMLWVIGVSMIVNVVLMTTYALVFSKPGMMAGYVQFRRWIEGTFALFFGSAAIYLVAPREH